MTRSRGALSITSINATYPHQVILVLTDWHRANLIRLLTDRERLGGYSLWTGKRHGIHDFNVAHFSTKESQEEFIRLYGGVPYDPSDKKSGPWETYFARCESPIL